jgi:nitrite reductase (NO-forming)
MVEYAFHLSTTTVHCGTVTFQVKNDGSAEHDMVFPSFGNASTPLVQPGGSSAFSVNFTNAGSFTYLCDVPGHDRLGMIGTLIVTQ